MIIIASLSFIIIMIKKILMVSFHLLIRNWFYPTTKVLTKLDFHWILLANHSLYSLHLCFLVTISKSNWCFPNNFEAKIYVNPLSISFLSKKIKWLFFLILMHSIHLQPTYNQILFYYNILPLYLYPITYFIFLQLIILLRQLIQCFFTRFLRFISSYLHFLKLCHIMLHLNLILFEIWKGYPIRFIYLIFFNVPKSTKIN